jgi:hypothetical protein
MSQNGAAGNPPESDAEQMRYGMLGGGASTGDLQKLEKYTGVVGWDYLRPHFENGALLYVDPSLVLTEVGAAISADNTASVEGWLKSGDLVKPGAPHAEFWAGSSQNFIALVVSPFVLIQPISPSPDDG